ncbi:MAG: zinc dependent phospholipase C family protein [Flavisolibacter sp.]
MIRLLFAFFLLALSSIPCNAYSVLTHEALIDVAWDSYLVPLLKQRYHLNDSLLKEAHAYAYGGAVAPDMGYYPFGSKLFTNLVHYVRSGDFVTAILNEAQNADEFAFALGVTCHYFADTYGHPLGVNPSVPIAYPKLKEKFGKVVTYEEDPVSHKRVEFAFDVTQTARGNYASQSYHDFIGFKVATPVLERAFYKTYDLHLDEVFSNLDRAVGTFRWSVKNFFPALTKAAWASKKPDIRKSNEGITGRKFKYQMKRANYNKEFGKERDKPKFFSFLFSGLIKILPKIGPLRPLKFKTPGPEVEKLYIASFDTVQSHYRLTIKKISEDKLFFKDKDLDTGKDEAPGEYKFTDATYCEWLLKLQDKRFDSLDLAPKQDIIQFFQDPQKIISTQKNKHDQEKIMKALDQLKQHEVTTKP